MQRLGIDSSWRMTWTEYGERLAEFAAPGFDDSLWHRAEVPGDVHLDLMRAGLIPDPFVGTNSDAVLWMEQKDWWYRTRFAVPADWPEEPGRATRLVFHGLDCFATVYVNGREVARHANMFRPLEVDVTGWLPRGTTSVLAVRLESPLFAPLDRPSRQTAAWGFPRPLCRKAQMSFGWDIAPRLVTIGIWKPVELVAIDGARVSDACIRTRALVSPAGQGATAADMEAIVEVEALAGAAAGLRVEFGVGAKTLRHNLPAGPGRHEVRFEWRIEDPQLWWPNGSGMPHLYPWHVRVVGPNGRAIDERAGQFGVRTIELDRSPTSDDGHRFQFRVNGREIFMRGWNWTPPDAIFARTTAGRRQDLLEAAWACGANMLRIWGGGVYEPDDFFEACDRLGLLVYQDFMMACSKYPLDEAFLAEMRAEAEHVVRSLRGHASLALWSGDNECDAMYPSMKEADGNRITRGVIPEVLARFDAKTPYIPSSPHSPAQRRYNDDTDSEAHLWYHGRSYEDPYFTEHRAKFVSETGFLSLPNVDVVLGYLGDAPPWPPEGKVWDFHAADCLRVRFFRGMKALADNLKSCGRPAPQSLEEYVAVSQQLHAEAFRRWVAYCASRKDCGGILLWNLADCWPQMSDAVIAYPFSFKPAYFAAKEAFAAAGRL